jgi:hypothetical protein
MPTLLGPCVSTQSIESCGGNGDGDVDVPTSESVCYKHFSMTTRRLLSGERAIINIVGCEQNGAAFPNYGSIGLEFAVYRCFPRPVCNKGTYCGSGSSPTGP